MQRFLLTKLLPVALVFTAAGAAYLKFVDTGTAMTTAAKKYVAKLDDEQKAIGLLPYDSEQRVGWHFIPKDYRKGVQAKTMTAEQREAAFELLKTALSEVGYTKATTIMSMESLLQELKKDPNKGPIRDRLRYYWTVFGTPDDDGRWGLSIEGHHLSLNFVVDKGHVLSSTPTFFAANPTIVQHESAGGPPKGTRVLAKEETLAFDLLTSLDETQRSAAVIDEKAPREIRAAGEAAAPAYAADGLCANRLNAAQGKILRQLVTHYANNLPADLAQARLSAIREAGVEKVYFAWAGADRPGIGHYYRIQGPTFLIEFVNTQPDAAGNPASHIHCVWRDPNGDFAIPVQ